MNSCIYDKTAKGREEIATRKYQVPPKLRTLLVMIDGRHSLGSLLTNFAGLGLSAESVDELVAQEYIMLVSGGPAASEAEPEAPRAANTPASARARILARQAARQGRVAATEAGQSERMVEPPTPPAPPDSAERFRALYAFYNQTIKSTIGLRGIVLQLKVEKAGGIEDFRAPRLPYLQAMFKAKRREVAASLRDHLDTLLGGKPETDDFDLPHA